MSFVAAILTSGGEMSGGEISADHLANVQSILSTFDFKVIASTRY